MSKILEVNDIKKMIPHRYPMLMIDRVIDIRDEEGEKGAVAIKNVTINESFFQGHFPTKPVMPGVLLVEAMAQTAGVYIAHCLGEEGVRGKLVYFMTIDEARFRRPVVPGDQVRIEVKLQRNVKTVWKFKGEARVDGALCAEAIYSAMVIDGPTDAVA